MSRFFDKPERILKIVQSATNAGGSITLAQLRDRVPSSSENIRLAIHRLEKSGLVTVTKGEDLHGSLTIRAVKK